jgi:phosphoesterase RecJ-like protein
MSSTRQTLLKQAAEQIRTANRVLIACHVRPDADALGSLLGLAVGLEQLGKTVDAVSPDGVPALYRFLPGWERLITSAPSGRHWDLGIGLDADGSDRLGAAEAAVLAQPIVIDLDHHTGPDPFGQVQVVDRTAAATGELVYELLRELGAPITPDIAVCLLAALLTDTGSFRFANSSPRAFQVAAELVEAGARPGPIFDAIYGRRSFGASRLLGILLSGLQRSDDGLIVWGCLHHEDFGRAGVDTSDTEGYVDQVRMVEGSEVAIFFREDPPGEIRVSLRSHGGANVARVAEQFDGGGHVPAAGCTVKAPMAEAVRLVLDAVRKELRTARPAAEEA